MRAWVHPLIFCIQDKGLTLEQLVYDPHPPDDFQHPEGHDPVFHTQSDLEPVRIVGTVAGDCLLLIHRLVCHTWPGQRWTGSICLPLSPSVGTCSRSARWSLFGWILLSGILTPARDSAWMENLFV